MDIWLKENRIYFGKDGKGAPQLKRYLKEVQDGRVPSTWWTFQEVGHNDAANKELQELFKTKAPFDTPKPVSLIKQMLKISTKNDDLILDFFAGSSTTAESVFSINAEDSGCRRFIMIQIDEQCVDNSEAFRSGYKNIADISKERIRRAGAKIRTENATTAASLDIGFRVLKIDTSNMEDVFYAPDEVKQGDMMALADNIKPDRTPEDLLFQVLVDWGVDLSLPITSETIQGKKVFFVDGNALAACFDANISEDLVKELAERKPLRAVFRDSSFENDTVKINVEQIFKLLSPETEVKSI
jgi:adenine-specific DNA-methyltransferase